MMHWWWERHWGCSSRQQQQWPPCSNAWTMPRHLSHSYHPCNTPRCDGIHAWHTPHLQVLLQRMCRCADPYPGTMHPDTCVHACCLAMRSTIRSAYPVWHSPPPHHSMLSKAAVCPERCMSDTCHAVPVCCACVLAYLCAGGIPGVV
jgi:hypothetical protein